MPTDSPLRANFLFSSPNDASIRARFTKQQTELIKDMITEAKNSLMGEIELKFFSLKS